MAGVTHWIVGSVGTPPRYRWWTVAVWHGHYADDWGVKLGPVAVSIYKLEWANPDNPDTRLCVDVAFFCRPPWHVLPLTRSPWRKTQ